MGGFVRALLAIVGIVFLVYVIVILVGYASGEREDEY